MNKNIHLLLTNIEKVILGKRDIILKIIAALLCNGHVLIEDVPGVGKTQLVESLARSINGVFNRIQLTPDIMPSDITGFTMIDPVTNEFVYRKGVAVCNFLLADEINRTSPKVQSSLLEIMEEHQITIDSKTYRLPKPFMVLATQNSLESHGTYHLPDAQMDRFLIKLSIGYPKFNDELKILEHVAQGKISKNLSPVLSLNDILELREEVNQIHVDVKIQDYIIRLITSTRKNENFKLGLSPRGSIGLFNMSKALAYIRGNDFVTPDDVAYSAPLVLPHRLILSAKGKSLYKTNDFAIKELLKQVELPDIDQEL